MRLTIVVAAAGVAVLAASSPAGASPLAARQSPQVRCTLAVSIRDLGPDVFVHEAFHCPRPVRLNGSQVYAQAWRKGRDGRWGWRRLPTVAPPGGTRRVGRIVTDHLLLGGYAGITSRSGRVVAGSYRAVASVTWSTGLVNSVATKPIRVH